ncbi:MAG: hypothetical protein V7761_02535 [Amylibacter sp.]
MLVTVGNITLFMGPHTLGRPDDLEAAIIDFIARIGSSPYRGSDYSGKAARRSGAYDHETGLPEGKA